MHDVHERLRSAGASTVCAVLDMLADGSLPARGFVRQEDIALDAFLANRFGQAYAQHEMASRLAS